MADYRPSLHEEANQVMATDKLLKQNQKSPEYKQWDTLFNEARKAYPPATSWQSGQIAPKIEGWVQLTAGGQDVHPNQEDMNVLAEKDGDDDAFFWRWRRLVDFARRILSQRQGSPTEVNAPSAGVAQIPATAGGNIREEGGARPQPVQPVDAHRTSVPQAPTPDVRQEGNTAEIIAVMPLGEPSDYRNVFSDLVRRADSLASQGRELQAWVTQYVDDTTQLMRASHALADTDWVTRTDYWALRQRHDAINGMNVKLRTVHTSAIEKQKELAKEREDARIRTAELLIEQARGMWKQFNLASKAERQASDHSHNLALQVYLNIVDILAKACGVQTLEIQEGDLFDDKFMALVNYVDKPRDNALRGCVALIHAPGFRDETGMWKAQVMVYRQ